MTDPVLLAHLQQALLHRGDSLASLDQKTWRNYLRVKGWTPEEEGWWIRKREGLLTVRVPLSAPKGHPIWDHVLNWVASAQGEDPALVLAELLQEESKNGSP